MQLSFKKCTKNMKMSCYYFLQTFFPQYCFSLFAFLDDMRFESLKIHQRNIAMTPCTGHSSMFLHCRHHFYEMQSSNNLEKCNPTKPFVGSQSSNLLPFFHLAESFTFGFIEFKSNHRIEQSFTPTIIFFFLHFTFQHMASSVTFHCTQIVFKV